MRRSLLLLGLAAASSAAGAHAATAAPPGAPPPIDLPGLPKVQPERPKSAWANRATFKVSLYGVQRFESLTTEVAGPEGPCWDSQGTTTSRSVVRFSTSRPTRAVIAKHPLGVGIVRWIGRGNDVPLPVKATFEHSGSVDGTARSCLEPELGWAPIPQPEARNCSATLDHLGFAIQFPRRGIEAAPEGGLAVPIGLPFEGCPWGDRSGDLYTAKRRLSLDDLLEQRETQVVLRARTRDEFDYGKTRGYDRRQTTIYVTFKKAR